MRKVRLFLLKRTYEESFLRSTKGYEPTSRTGSHYVVQPRVIPSTGYAAADVWFVANSGLTRQSEISGIAS
jgi:hypothetical protein